MMTKVEELLGVIQAGRGYEELTLECFRDIYHKIINRKILIDHTIFAIFIEDQILIRFPEKPRQAPQQFIGRIHHTVHQRR